MGAETYLRRRGDTTTTISPERHGGRGWVLVSRERHGVRVDVGLAAEDVESVVAAIREAAEQARREPTPAEEARRAHEVLGLRVRGRRHGA